MRRLINLRVLFNNNFIIFGCVINYDICDINTTTQSIVFIPWHNTQSLSKGIDVINRIYFSLPDNKIVFR